MGEGAVRRWYLRPLIALLLLTFEYLSISVVFDAFPLVARGGPLAVLGRAGQVGPVVIALATAFWILGGATLREFLSTAPPVSSRLATQIALQLVSFMVFFGMTAHVFGGGGPPPGSAAPWIAAWLASGFATGLAAIPIALGGRSLKSLLRELGAPLLFSLVLGIAALGAGLATLELWSRLDRITLHAVAALLKALVSPIHFDATEAEIGTDSFMVRIAPVCSGYEGIGLILVFLSAYLVAFRQSLRFPHVLSIVPVAVFLVWLLNAVRIVSLILVGDSISPEIAVGGFHSKAGWLMFCGVALGAVWVTRRVAWFQADRSHDTPRTFNPSAPFLLPLLAVIATGMFTGLFIGDFDYLYPVRVLVALLVLGWYRADYVRGLRERLHGRPIFSWQAIGIGVAVYVLWIGISVWTGLELAQPAPEALRAMPATLAAAWVVARAIGAAVTVPIVEELAFRGFLLRRIVSSDFARVPYDSWHWVAAVVSSLAFAALHQQWVGGFVAGMLYAYAQKHRGLLSDAIIAHAVTNALIAIEVTAVGHWSLW